MDDSVAAMIDDVCTTPRRKLSDRERRAVWERCKGRCVSCERKLFPGDAWQADHPRALGLGGEDRPDVLVVLCAWCFPTKNKDDAARIAHAKRQKASHISGPRKRSNRGFRGWRKFDGTVVWNNGR